MHQGVKNQKSVVVVVLHTLGDKLPIQDLDHMSSVLSIYRLSSRNVDVGRYLGVDHKRIKSGMSFSTYEVALRHKGLFIFFS